MSTNPTQHTDLFGPHLKSGEQLLWTGQPKQGFVFTGIDYVAIPFSIIWLLFSAFWLVLASIGDEDGAAWVFVIVGLPFFYVGLQMSVIRFYMDKNRRAITFYAVTNQRAMVIENYNPPRNYMYEAADLFDLRINRRNTNCDLLFGIWKIPQRKRTNLFYWPYGIVSGFRMIEDAAPVMQLLENLRDHKTHTTEPNLNQTNL